jgi:hypothetical protein
LMLASISLVIIPALLDVLVDGVRSDHLLGVGSEE